MSAPKDHATDPRHAAAGSAGLPGLPPPVLIGGYVVLVLLPLALAAAQDLPARGFWRELSSGLVMAGFAAMLVQFLLSGRFRTVSGKVGIDLTMRFHQLVAWSVLAFVVLHPLLYTAPRLWIDPAGAIGTLERMFASEGLRSGVVAWVLLLLLVPAAAIRDRLPVPYEVWRLSHGLAAAAIALLAAHHTLAVGTYSAAPALAAFWVVLAGVALLSLVNVYALKPLLQTRAPYRVVSNERAAEGMWEVAIEPERGRGIAFASGQFVWLNLGHSPFSLTEHPFSISSAPHQRPRIAFTIKESGDFTGRIGAIPVGTRAHLDGPHGAFTLAGRAPAGVVFIAGGVGLAPIMGILRHLHAQGFAGPVRLVYGNRAESQILYREEIEAMTDSLDLTVDHVLSEPPQGWRGRVGTLTADVLRDILGDAERAEHLFMVCGPPAMLDSVERSLVEMGVSPGRIVAERFRYD